MARLGRISGRLAGAGALAVAGVVTFAGVASAHGHKVTPTCSSLSVDLENYNDKVANSYVVTIDGIVKASSESFGKEFKQVFPVPADHANPITYEVKVVAGDDANPGPNDHNDWTFTETGTIPVCQPTPPPTTAPPTSQPPTSAPPTSQPPASQPPTSAPATSAAPTSAAPVSVTSQPPVTPAPATTGPSLAFTGGGSNAGMIAGIGAAVVVVGAGIVVVARRRSAPKH